MLRALALAARGRGRGLRRGDFSGGKGVPKGDVNTVKRSAVMDSRPLFAPEQFGDNACAPFNAQPAAAQRRMATLGIAPFLLAQMYRVRSAAQCRLAC